MRRVRLRHAGGAAEVQELCAGDYRKTDDTSRGLGDGPCARFAVTAGDERIAHSPLIVLTATG